MDRPEFKESEVLKVVAAIARDWSTAADAHQLREILRSVPDAQAYLRQVADLSPAAAQNLVRAALLGLTIAQSVDSMFKE